MKIVGTTFGFLYSANVFLPNVLAHTHIRGAPVCYQDIVEKEKKRKDEWVSIITDKDLLKLGYIDYWDQIGSKKYKKLGNMLQEIEQKVWRKNFNSSHGLTQVRNCSSIPYKKFLNLQTAGVTHRGLYSISVHDVETSFIRKDIDDSDTTSFEVDYSFCDKTKTGKDAICLVNFDWLGVRKIDKKKKKLQYQRYKFTVVIDTNGLAEDERFALPITHHTPGKFDKIIKEKSQLRPPNK